MANVFIKSLWAERSQLQKKRLNINAWRSVVKERRLCLNCLSAKHAVGLCPSSTLCRIYKHKYNNLLYLDKSAKSDHIANLEQAQTTTPKIAQFESAPSRLVLLATATIYVMNTFGRFIPFRIIPQRQDNAAKAMATKNRLGRGASRCYTQRVWETKHDLSTTWGHLIELHDFCVAYAAVIYLKTINGIGEAQVPQHQNQCSVL